MIVGSSSVFAIESEITEAVPGIGQLALGFFVIHISGQAFGVKEPDATMLGCSFGEVKTACSASEREKRLGLLA